MATKKIKATITGWHPDFEKPADMSKSMAKRLKIQQSPKPTGNPLVSALCKVIIQKLVLGKSRPSEKELLTNRRVVVVSAATVAKGREHLNEVLRNAGAFDDTAGDIVAVVPTSDVVFLAK